MHTMHYESEAGTWQMTLCEPPPDLAAYVDGFWETYGSVAYGYEKIVPRGVAELMINLGPPQQLIADTHGRGHQVFKYSWLAGIQTDPLYSAPLIANGKFTTHFVGASLHPSSIRPLLGVDACDTASIVTDLQDIVGSKADALHEDVRKQTSIQGRFGVLAAYLRKARDAAHRQASETAIYAMQRTIECNGNVRVADLQREVGVSRKHLNDLYKSAVGISPKMFARLTRFRWVMDNALSAPESWVKIATESGFFDQSHLIRDFRKFAGESPMSFVENRAPDGESVNYFDNPDASQNTR